MNKIEAKVIEIVAKNLRLEKDQITPQSRFADDLGADSLDQVELMMEFEATFGCDIPDDKAAEIVAVSDAVKYIEENVSQEEIEKATS